MTVSAAKRSTGRVLAWALLCVALPVFGQTIGTPINTAKTNPKAELPENGIKMGEGRVHPYFDLELRYDSAAGFFPASPNAERNGIAPEIVGHFGPGFRLDVPAHLVDFALNADVDYVWYTGLLSPGSERASRLEAGADLSALFNQGGQVGFNLTDRFSRSDRTTNAAIAVGVVSLFNEVSASVPFRPGGGALEVEPGGAYSVEFFSPIVAAAVTGCGLTICDATQVSQFNYQNFRGTLNGRYRFLPKTAIILDASYDLRSYFQAGSNLPSDLFRGHLGIAGLISPKIAVLAKLGYARDFVGAARTLIGHGELSYLINERSNVKFGYLRSIEPVPLFGSFGDDRGYVESNLVFAEKLRLQGYAAFDYLTYYGAVRHDTNVTFTLSPEYSVTAWFRVAVAYALSVRNSDQSGAATLNFTRHEALLRATFVY